jgi:hypothetical protein
MSIEGLGSAVCEKALAVKKRGVKIRKNRIVFIKGRRLGKRINLAVIIPRHNPTIAY